MTGDRRLRPTRGALRALASSVAAAAGLAVASASGAATAPDAGDPSAPADPMTIEVPYLSQTQITINAAWELVACPAVPADAPVIIDCDEQEGGIVVTAESYDPGAGPWDLPIEVTTADGTARTLDYLLALAAPEPPTPAAGLYEAPGTAGGRTLIPLAALVEECTYCAAGVRIGAQAVEPEDGPMLVRAWVGERHLVIDAEPGATEAVIEITVEDDAGGVSQPAELTVPLLAAPASPALGLHLVVPAQETVEVSATELVADSSDAVWSIVACPQTVRGSVACDGDSVSFARAGAPDGLEDQLALTLMSEDGRSVTASVTVSPSAPSTRLAGAAPEQDATVPLATRAPATTTRDDAGADTGVLTSLWSRIPSLP